MQRPVLHLYICSFFFCRRETININPYCECRQTLLPHFYGGIVLPVSAGSDRVLLWRRDLRHTSFYNGGISTGADLRRDHTLSSDLPLMRFFFISPQQKISSLHIGNETDSEFEVFSKRMAFWNSKSNFICFSIHTRSSSCQLGKCTRKLLLIPLIAMKSGNALDLPLSGISLNTSIVLDCMNSPK